MPKQRPRMFEFNRYGARSAHPLPAGTPPVGGNPPQRCTAGHGRVNAPVRGTVRQCASSQLPPTPASATSRTRSFAADSIASVTMAVTDRKSVV